MEQMTIAAVDIGGTKIACGLVSIGEAGGATPVASAVEKIPTEAAQGGEHVLARVISAVQAALERAEGPVAGVGISSAGVVDPRTGDITFANELMPGWGGGRKASSCLVVAVGTGIGGAITHPTSLTSWFKAEVEK